MVSKKRRPTVKATKNCLCQPLWGVFLITRDTPRYVFYCSYITDICSIFETGLKFFCCVSYNIIPGFILKPQTKGSNLTGCFYFYIGLQGNLKKFKFFIAPFSIYFYTKILFLLVNIHVTILPKMCICLRRSVYYIALMQLNDPHMKLNKFACGTFVFTSGQIIVAKKEGVLTQNTLKLPSVGQVYFEGPRQYKR